METENILLDDQWVIEAKTFQESCENENTIHQSLGDSKGSAQREVYTYEHLNLKYQRDLK
jgi:hypothetical protein